jgi:RecA-family ATPase
MTKPFTLEIHEPFSTFTEGAPTPIPFVIDSLLPKAALSVLGGKAKHGKSSMSRCEAVSVAKGLPFLDRPTTQGEVLLCSLEDPRQACR